MGVTLVGGGARSGKSAFAQRRCEERGGLAVFVATGEARDDEMRDRIRRHQADRGERWRTVEEPLDLVGVLEREALQQEPVLVDCLTLWLSNVLLDPERNAQEEIERLTALLEGWGGPELTLITNEVGLGIVPENALAREFRDLAGRLNQAVARAADEVWWIVFGLPLKIKGGSDGALG